MLHQATSLRRGRSVSGCIAGMSSSAGPRIALSRPSVSTEGESSQRGLPVASRIPPPAKGDPERLGPFQRLDEYLEHAEVTLTPTANHYGGGSIIPADTPEPGVQYRGGSIPTDVAAPPPPRTSRIRLRGPLGARRAG